MNLTDRVLVPAGKHVIEMSCALAHRRLVFACSLLACACTHTSGNAVGSLVDPTAAALAGITAEDIGAHVAVLASDTEATLLERLHAVEHRLLPAAARDLLERCR